MKQIKRNSPAEEADIQRGIAADLDMVEWTDKDFAQARLATDILPPEFTLGLKMRHRTLANKRRDAAS